MEPVADQVGGGLVAGIEDENDVVQQLALGQPLAVLLALDEPGQHVALGIAWMRPPPRHQRLQVGEEVPHRRLAVRLLLGRQRRLQRAEDRQRPRAQRLALLARHGQQVADHLDRHGGRQIADQIGRALGFDAVEQAVDQLGHRPFHVEDRARREGAGDDPAHARVQRRIVEHQARRVVLEQQSVAVLGRKLALLVGGESPGILVDGDAGGIARQKISAVRHPVHRARVAQRMIVGIGIGVVARRAAAAGRKPAPRQRLGFRRRSAETFAVCQQLAMIEPRDCVLQFSAARQTRNPTFFSSRFIATVARLAKV